MPERHTVPRPGHTSKEWRRSVAVVAGGVVGTGLRMAVNELVGDSGTGAWPWPTFVANISGALVLGLLVGGVLATARPDTLRFPFLVVGLLGGYTTFSVLSVEVWELVDTGHALLGTAYAGASLAAGYSVVWLGLQLGGSRR